MSKKSPFDSLGKTYNYDSGLAYGNFLPTAGSKPSFDFGGGDVLGSGTSNSGTDIGGGFNFDTWGMGDGDGAFSLGDTLDTVSGVAGLFSQLQTMFGGDPRFKEMKKANDANILNQTLARQNMATAGNNQIARGAGERARVSGGKDPFKKFVA